MARHHMMQCIKGVLPSGLKGVYIKNGPNVSTQHIIKSQPSLDFLDEPGCLQKIEFNNGVATYKQRVIEIAPRPIKAFGGPFIPLHNDVLQNAGNTNVVPYGTGYWALYDGGVPYEVHANTLASEEVTSIKGFMNSHPKNGVFLTLQYILAPSRGAIHTCMSFNTIRCTYPSFLYVHDFLVVGPYFVVFDHQLDIDMSMMHMNGIGYRITPKPTGGFIVLISRTSGRIIARIPGCTGFSTHHLGAHYQYVKNKNTLVIATIEYDSVMNSNGKVVVYTICLKTMTLQNVKKNPTWCEFPVPISPTKIILSMIRPQFGLGVFDFTDLSLRPMEQTLSDTLIHGEFAYDRRTALGMCYTYDTLKDYTTLKLFKVHDAADLQDSAELAFPTKNVPLGLHGTFLPS